MVLSSAQQYKYRKNTPSKEIKIKTVCLPQLCFLTSLFLNFFLVKKLKYFFKEPPMLYCPKTGQKVINLILE